MSQLTRRQLLQRLVGCVTGAATVVLARTVLASDKETPNTTPPRPDERADRLAAELPPLFEGTEPVSFANRAFRNGGGGGGGFRNGGFRNF